MFVARITRRALAGPSRFRRRQVLLFGGALLLVAVSVLVRALNHDEGQYVAAIASMRRGLPYRDFPYLQTPLQPLLFSPLSLLPAGWLYLSVRIANAMLGAITLALVWAALRTRASPRAAMIAVGALACTNIFLFASAEARNDALPMALLAAAIAVHLTALERRRTIAVLAGAGLLYGLAASAKISFAIPAAAAAIIMVGRARGADKRPAAALGAGVVIGLIPSIVLAAISPAEFRFDVFTYSMQAPQQYWTAVGQHDLLTPPVKLRDLLVLALAGPMLIAFGLAAFDRRRSEAPLLLDALIIAGLVSAYLPDPSFAQYWVPVLPPLFIRFGMSLDGQPRLRRKRILWLTAVGCVAGLGPTAVMAARSWLSGPPIAAGIVDSRYVARLANGGRIVSLAPELFSGADSDFDARFVTGPFLFRTFGPLSAKALALGLSPNWQRLAASLDTRPPAVIVTGTEGKARPPIYPHGLDRPLIAWAQAHHYRARRAPSGQLLLFTDPALPESGRRGQAAR